MDTNFAVVVGGAFVTLPKISMPPVKRTSFFILGLNVSDRKPISKKLRFEIFKRDSFTCQYCGRKAPDVILEVDHIQPKAEDGDDGILNLITSCFECNRGKSDRLLSDNAILERQREQMALLQERKEQIEMMFEWQKELMQQDDEIVNSLSEIFDGFIKPFYLNELGKASLGSLVKKFSIGEIINAIKISTGHYLQFDYDGQVKKESIEIAINKLRGILVNTRKYEKNPHLKDLDYAKGILRKRFENFKVWDCVAIMERAYQAGVPTEQVLEFAKDSSSYSEWRADMTSMTTYLEKTKGR